MKMAELHCNEVVDDKIMFDVRTKGRFAFSVWSEQTQRWQTVCTDRQQLLTFLARCVEGIDEKG
jgi:hypothetical protein